MRRGAAHRGAWWQQSVIAAMVAAAVVVVVPAAPVEAAATDGAKLETVAAGLSNPVDVTAPPGDDRLFIVEKGGRIRILEEGTVLATPFLDVSSSVATTGEQGLLGMAFDPDYTDNGRFYIHYTAAGSGSNVIRRYSVSNDPNVAQVGSGVTLLTQSQPRSNHNGGQVAIGPDGYLYASIGDGGKQGDPDGNGQNKNTKLGSIVRIDPVTGQAPADNPFVDAAGHDKIWVYGFRNPWRFSFDAATGGMYIGDVGQNSWEEIDYVGPHDGGNNYGWNEREGAHCYPAGSGCSATGLTDPILDYAHPDVGCSGSVTGGVVYRGNDLPWLRGHYFYADWCRNWLKSFRYDGSTVSDKRTWTGALNAPSSITAFGTDGHGEMYLAAGSTVRKLVPDRTLPCDFDGNDMVEVAVGVAGEDHSGSIDAGLVQVFDGTSAGPDAAADAVVRQAGPLVGSSEPSDAFGSAVACGDFDGDGYGDLAVGAPGKSEGAGTVLIVPGSAGGLDQSAGRSFHENTQGIGLGGAPGDGWGSVLAVADFDADGFDDLAIGVPFDDGNGATDAGAVGIVYGSASGLTASGFDSLHQDGAGMAGIAESGDLFGAGLAAGDLDGDGYADLAIGLPGQHISGFEDAGAIHVVYGEKAGLGTRDEIVHRDSSGIKGKARANLFFGASVAMGSFDNDGFDDLAVGVPGASHGAGEAAVVYGNASGVSTRDVRVRQGKNSINGRQEAGDNFGLALATGDLNGDGYDELVVGAPGEATSGVADAGLVGVLPGGIDRLDFEGYRALHRAGSGVAGELGADDLFGRALRVGDVTGDGIVDLLVGVPGDGPPAGAGSVQFFAGSKSGLDRSSDFFWSQDSAGSAEVGEGEDAFGGGL